MPRLRGIMMTSRSMRASRTSGNLTESSKQNIQQSRSDPMDLRRVNTDDSSVFSGLASIHHEHDVENDENRSVRSVRFEDEVPPVIQARGRKTRTTSKQRKQDSREKRYLKGFQITESISEDDETGEESNRTMTTGGSGSDSERSALRNLRPVADYDSAFMDENESVLRQNDLVTDYSYNQDGSTSYNQDASTISYASVNEFERPRGKIRLLSDIQVLQSGENSNSSTYGDESVDSPPTPEGAEAISSLLKDFGRELDENILSLTDNRENDYQGLSEWQDIVPRRVQSEDDHHALSSHQSKQLHIALHQVRREVEILRDNNEQFMSEIEQTEEEHESEMKLYDERTKQKIFELKAMYQEEIDALIQEKDAAIAEAGRQAARYAESGRKQIASLKKQIEKLKLHANEAVKKAVHDSVAIVKRKNDEEVISKFGALRKSYESKLDDLRRENDLKVRTAVNEAVANVTQKLMEESHREARSPHADQIVETMKRENAHLLSKQDAMVKALQSVKENLNKHYSEQMIAFRDKSRHNSNPMALLRSGSADDSSLEGLFREVVESFAYLIERAEDKVTAAQEELTAERSKKERNEVYMQARKDLMMKHRAELDYARKQNEETKEKNERLEHDLKIITKEKRALQEKFRRDTESHRLEVRRLQEKVIDLENTHQRRENPFHAAARERRKNRESNGRCTENDIDEDKDLLSKNNQADEILLPVPRQDSASTTNIRTAIAESRDDVEQLRSPSQSPLYGLQIQSERAERTFGNGDVDNRIDRENVQAASSPSHRNSEVQIGLQPPSRTEAPNGRCAEDPEALKAFSEDSKNQATHSAKDAHIMRSHAERGAENDVNDDEGNIISKKEPHGIKDGSFQSVCVHDHDQGKKKSFGILRSFKPSRTDLLTTTRDPDTSTMGQEPDGRTEPSPHPKNKAGTVSKIRNFFDVIGKTESTHARRGSFTDESTSSLRTNTGVSSPRSKSMRSTRSGNLTVEGSRSHDDDNEKLLKHTESASEHTRSSMRKKKNPLGMFANRRKPSMSPEKEADAKDDHDCTGNDDEHTPKHERHHGDTEKEFKKPPLPGFDLKNDKKHSTAAPHVLDGRKPPLREWTEDENEDPKEERPQSLDDSPDPLRSETIFPSTIDVLPPTNRKDFSTVGMSSHGHTLCLRPHALEGKSHNEGLSSVTGNSNESSSGALLSRNVPSLNSHCGGGHGYSSSSQIQMRKYPPLGDQSDDESRDECADKYESFEKSEQLRIEYGSPMASEKKNIPLVVSRSIDDVSPLLYMDPSNDSKPIVVQGQAISRKPGLSAFTANRDPNDSDSNNGSEATTAITAHTFRSSYNTDPGKLRELSRRNTPSPMGSSSRRATTVAALKARRTKRQSDF